MQRRGFSVSDGVIISRFWVLFQSSCFRADYPRGGCDSFYRPAPAGKRRDGADRASRRRAVCWGNRSKRRVSGRPAKVLNGAMVACHARQASLASGMKSRATQGTSPATQASAPGPNSKASPASILASFPSGSLTIKVPERM